MEEKQYPFVLPPLPYPYDALEPDLDSKLLCFHHDKHFAAYVDNLNKLLESYPAYQDWSLIQLCEHWMDLPPQIRQGVRNNAGGVFNHDIYFRTLHALPPSSPQPRLGDAIRLIFGSTDGLRIALKSAALSVFGSGWTCLCTDSDGILTLENVANQDTVLPLVPLLCCDVWEHAYYLQYQNRRGDYLDAWWRLINWPLLSEQYAQIVQNRPSMT